MTGNKHRTDYYTGRPLIVLYGVCVCMHASGIPYMSAVYTFVPVGNDILEADKQLSVHVQFVDSGVDGISTGSVTMESITIGNNQKNSASNLEHFPVCGTECLD